MKKMLRNCLFLSLAVLLCAGCTSSAENGREEVYTSQQNISDQGTGSTAYYLNEAETLFEPDLLSDAKEMTVSFWVRPESNFLWTTLFSSGKNEEHFIQLSSSGNPEGETCGINFSLRKGKKEARILSAEDKTMQTGMFNHIALTWKKKQVSLYLNGEKIGEGPVPVTLQDMDLSSVLIGKSAFFDDPVLQGVFQDLKISNYALSAEEILMEFDSLYPEMVLDTFRFSNSEDQRENLFVPTYKQKEGLWIGTQTYHGLPVYFSSSDPQWISDYGEVTLPEVQQGDQTVIMTAHTEYKGRQVSRDFEFHLLADSEQTRLKRDLDLVKNDLQPIRNENDLLPQMTDQGTELDWSVVSGEIEIVDHRIIKTSDEERTKACLRVDLTQGEHSASYQQDIVVLDEYTGYLLSYFNGEEGQERGKLAYSRDGLHWESVNGNEPYFTSELGSGRIRDPFLGRDKDGNFVILATEGFDHPEIYIWRSEDLVDLSDHQRVPVALKDPFLHLSGERAWAPEMIYDPQQDLYTIVYSDPSAGDESGLYAVTTRDFIEFSYPQIFFKRDYPVIDGTFIQMQGKYWMFYKDESRAAQTVYYAETEDLSDFFEKAHDTNFLYPLKYMEGPFVFKVNQKEEYYLYQDHFPKGEFHVARFTHLDPKPDFEWLEPQEVSLPEDHVRHGSVLAVTEKELQRILEAHNR